MRYRVRMSVLGESFAWLCCVRHHGQDEEPVRAQRLHPEITTRLHSISPAASPQRLRVVTDGGTHIVHCLARVKRDDQTPFPIGHENLLSPEQAAVHSLVGCSSSCFFWSLEDVWPLTEPVTITSICQTLHCLADAARGGLGAFDWSIARRGRGGFATRCEAVPECRHSQ